MTPRQTAVKQKKHRTEQSSSSKDSKDLPSVNNNDSLLIMLAFHLYSKQMWNKAPCICLSSVFDGLNSFFCCNCDITVNEYEITNLVRPQRVNIGYFIFFGIRGQQTVEKGEREKI